MTWYFVQTCGHDAFQARLAPWDIRKSLARPIVDSHRARPSHQHLPVVLMRSACALYAYLDCPPKSEYPAANAVPCETMIWTWDGSWSLI